MKLDKNFTVQWLALLLHTWEVVGSGLAPKIGFTDKGVCDFSQVLHANPKLC